MSVELNHTIVGARDKHASARFLAGILGREVGEPFGPFTPVVLDNAVTLDYLTLTEVRPQHYAFLVGDEEFDAAFARIQASGLTYWADPGHRAPGELNHRWGGRGLYFSDPDGHNMEILTRTP
ncbi:VOC family protein [Streptomyces sp. NPDC046805]|uniref:VOC family protein n=1 Tax=Streptomyces sp. NPDC046805 TaxID=3155134 RepID=UPI0033C309E5